MWSEVLLHQIKKMKRIFAQRGKDHVSDNKTFLDDALIIENQMRLLAVNFFHRSGCVEEILGSLGKSFGYL